MPKEVEQAVEILKVRFSQNAGGYDEGDEAEFSAVVAQQYIDAGQAVAI